MHGVDRIYETTNAQPLRTDDHEICRGFGLLLFKFIDNVQILALGFGSLGYRYIANHLGHTVELFVVSRLRRPRTWHSSVDLVKPGRIPEADLSNSGPLRQHHQDSVLQKNLI